MSGLLSRWNQRRENVAKEAEQQEAEQHDVSLTRQTETDDSAATKGQAADVNSNVQQGEQAARGARELRPAGGTQHQAAPEVHGARAQPRRGSRRG